MTSSPPSIRAELLDTTIGVESDDRGSRPSAFDALFDGEMRVGVRGNLRQVRDAEYLKGRPQRTQLPSHDVRHTPADARVDFVEDKAWRHAAWRPLRRLGPSGARRRRQAS